MKSNFILLIFLNDFSIASNIAKASFYTKGDFIHSTSLELIIHSANVFIVLNYHYTSLKII